MADRVDVKEQRGTAEGCPSEKLSDEVIIKLDELIKKYKKKPGSLIPVLQEAQEFIGYLPPTALKYIAKGLRIHVSEVHGVVSFYSFFTMKPRGDHNIRVCLGTACYVKGIEGVLHKISDALKIKIGETTENRKFSLEAVRCLGACGLAPVMVIDQETYGAMTAKKALDIISQYDP